MGSGQPATPKNYLETGTEPEYFVTDTRMEPAGGGNVRVYCYSSRHGDLVLLYTAVVPAASLVGMGRQAMQVGASTHNMSQWADMVGDGQDGH